MPRAPRQKRQPTEADLNEDQREIYDALSDDLKQKFLKGLPSITVSSAGRRRKAQMIRDRVNMLDEVISGLQNHKKNLQQLAKNLDQGAVNAESIDRRQELKPPAIPGVAMRYVRARRRES